MPEPFLIFPWTEAFLPALKKYVAEQTSGQPGKCLIIVPNQRPWRYFSALYGQEKRPGVLPRMMPFAQMAAMWCASVCQAPYTMANPLEQAYLLYECVQELGRADKSLAADFAEMDMARFLPWGLRLADLIEDIFLQGLTPHDLSHLEGDVEPLAAALLAKLGRISELYRKKLEGALPQLMTPGLEFLTAAEHAQDIPVYLRPLEARPVLIAGFSLLNGAENRLFHSLWEAGARVCVQADANLPAGEFDEACKPIADWIRAWRAQAEVLPAPLRQDVRFSFYAAYDAHSQIEQMVKDIELDTGEDPGASKAIVLAGADLLMPVLHHLPAGDINISMGYPLRRAQLQSFLDDIFQLQSGRQKNGRFYWRSLVRLFSQPYLGILERPDEPEINLHKALVRMNRRIRQNETKFVDLDKLKAGIEIDEEERAFLEQCLELLVYGMAEVETPGELASQLGRICNFLIECGQNSWKRFPLDAEALSRLQNRILPVLGANPLRNEKFTLRILERILASLLESERIPFEAEPLVGTQILGLFETRLLHFDDIYVLDASDDKLPGTKGQDPLLPDSLAGLAGLPNASTREKITRYNLFRLLASAKKARLYWPEGGSLSEGGKRYRSRYVEQLIWKEEQKRGKILKNDDGLLRSARSLALLNRCSPSPIARDARLTLAMEKLLAGKISATLLNSYMSCPASFVRKRLLRLSLPDEVNEGEDYGEAGTCIHNTLAEILEPYLNQKITLADIDANVIKKAFRRQLLAMQMPEKMPVDSWLVFEDAGFGRLKNYFENCAEPTFIKSLETMLIRDITINGRRHTFEGKLDRLDTREGETVVLDYKTGVIHSPAGGLWQNQAFFASLEQYIEEHPDKFDEEGDELLAQLREKLPDVQLGLYLMLSDAANAAYIDLKKTGREVPFFNPATDGARDDIVNSCKIAIAFILAHMRNAPQFVPIQDKCAKCDYAAICQV